MKPTISILDPRFVYVPEASTDIRKTFRRVIREQKEIARAKAEQAARERSHVVALPKRRA